LERKLKFETNKNKSIGDSCRCINGSKTGYQSRTNSVKDNNGDLLADSNNILSRWKNYFCQLLNVNGVNDVR